MPRCIYCGKMYDIPKGLTLVKVDGTICYLCSSKCRKNMLMKRRKVRWVSKKKKGETTRVAPKLQAFKKKKKSRK